MKHSRGYAAEAVEEHDAIYRAIRDGRPDAAADATVVHLDNTLLDYRREIQRRVFGESAPSPSQPVDLRDPTRSQIS